MDAQIVSSSKHVTASKRPASHKFNPSSVPQGYMDSYSTLAHVGGGNRCREDTL